MRVNPPIFDAQGRGGQLVVQDDYIFRTLESGAMKAMIDASEGQRQSLWDVEEFQIMANGLSELRPYSVFLSTDVASFQKQMRDTVRRVPQSRLDENPLLPYKAFSVGTGEDEVGRFIAIVLVHADSETAEQNAERLLRRIEENPRVQSGSVIKGSWRETVRDVYNLEIRAEEEALLAKLHLSGTLNSNGFHPNGSTWQHYVLGLAVADPLLLHE
jgi:hypothetical protein